MVKLLCGDNDGDDDDNDDSEGGSVSSERGWMMMIWDVFVVPCNTLIS